MRNAAHILSTVLALGFAATTVTANTPADPREFVRDQIDQLRDAVSRDRARLEEDPSHAISLVDQLVTPHVDTERTAKLILGKHWRVSSPAQRQQFIENFKQLLLRTYAVHAGDYLDAEVAYLASRIGDERKKLSVVRTRVTQPGKRPVNIDYRMLPGSDGWKVFDVVVNGVSLVATFRSAIDI
jgi:phospholipid transport system substrate-binding protein